MSRLAPQYVVSSEQILESAAESLRRALGWIENPPSGARREAIIEHARVNGAQALMDVENVRRRLRRDGEL